MAISYEEGSAKEPLAVSLPLEHTPPPPPASSQDLKLDTTVRFDDDADPGHPHNWPLTTKLKIGAVLGLSTFTVAFNSALFSAGTAAFAAEFNVSRNVGTLGVSLYVLGFATGPIFWAPISELKGRWWPIVLGMLGFSVFSLGVAAGKDVQTVLLCRFWSGIFGASPMTIVAGVFTDMFDSQWRGLATTVFSMNVLMGPMLAPSVGGFIAESYLGWRWTGWLASIMGFVGLGLDLVFLRETYCPSILTSRAASMRRQTQNWALHSEQEETEVDMRRLVTKYLSRPLLLLFTEPLVFLISVYLAFIYGIVYLFLTAYPIVFQEIHGMSEGIGGLCYMGMLLGILSGGLYLTLTQSSYRRKLSANNNVPVPEWRLPPAVPGAVSFAIGVLWFGWTGYRADIHWILPTISGVLTGFGILTIFQQLLNYLVDTYLPVIASVNAGSSILRSLCGATFPLFAQTMFDSLGVNWASTILGGVAIACIPIPIGFYVWGPRLRTKSKFISHGI